MLYIEHSFIEQRKSPKFIEIRIMQENRKNKYRHYGDIITADFFFGIPPYPTAVSSETLPYLRTADGY